MNTRLTRLKLSLLLTPAIYLPAIWILALSFSPLIASLGVTRLLGWGLLMSFGCAMAIIQFISLLRSSERPDT